MFSGTGSLELVRQPEIRLGLTNCVYVSPVTFRSLHTGDQSSKQLDQKQIDTKADPYVEVKGMIFNVRSHSSLRDDQIGVNLMHLQSMDCVNGDRVEWKPFRLPNDPSFIASELQVEFERHVVGDDKDKIVFAEEDIAQNLKHILDGQIVTKGQQLWGQVHGKHVKYQIVGVRTLFLQPSESKSKSKSKTYLVETKTGYVPGATIKLKINVKTGARYTMLSPLAEKAPKEAVFDPDWSFSDMGIGGLDAEFGFLFRRAFASRLFPPETIRKLGISHVKGILLYGPPGTGKTLIARQIGKMLNGREPKVVNGPEVLNKFVGASEENIRKLFVDAEKEQMEKKEQSGLHIIIFDEIDAICKTRGRVANDTGVHDTVLNQLLSKIDGVNSLNNILVIGMTNRKDMIDPALLRPGRLEVHIEISLPDEEGRKDILHIHTKTMAENKRLSEDVDIGQLASLTKNFSGAELEGLVKSASSFALYAAIDASNAVNVKVVDEKDILVTMSHFRKALTEVVPAFGVSDDAVKTLAGSWTSELIRYSPAFDKMMELGASWIQQVRNSEKTKLLSVLLEGAPGAGKSAIAAHFAMSAKFPYTKVISPEHFIGYSDAAKCAAISKVFEDAYKSPLSLIILDDIERLLDYVSIGPRFSNVALQTILVLAKRQPPTPHCKLFVLATTSSVSILRDMEFQYVFNIICSTPLLRKPEHVKQFFKNANIKIDEKEMNSISEQCPLPLGIKQMLLLVEMTRVQGSPITTQKFLECAGQCSHQEARPKLTPQKKTQKEAMAMDSGPPEEQPSAHYKQEQIILKR